MAIDERADQAQYHLGELIRYYLLIWDRGDAEAFERVLEKEVTNEQTRNAIRTGVLTARGIAQHKS